MNQTSVEKIAQCYAVGLKPGTIVRAGAFITIRPKHVMTHDNTGAVIPKFHALAGKDARIRDPCQPVFAIDHDIQNTTPENLGKYARIEAFAREQGVDYYPPGRGIAHQVMVEEGYVAPGSMVVGSDSHSNLYGAAAALGTPVVRTDAAAIWATGETWWQVPEQARVTLTGTLPRGASGKDVIITLCGHFNQDEVLNCAVEFHGDGVSALTMDERMTIANMTTEWGALVGMFPFDEVLRDYLLARAEVFARRKPAPHHYTCADVEKWWTERSSFAPDADACYARELTLDLSSVTPHVSGPNSVKVMASLPEIEPKRIRINKAYLMSCVNARLSDFAEAAHVFRPSASEPPRRVAHGVHFYVAAASSEIEAEARSLGYWDTLIQAGAEALPAGCGACIGLGKGTLEPGEVGISATNRNFQGRMGSRDALCYLASPAVVAESAIKGHIAAPGGARETAPRGAFRLIPRAQQSLGATEIIDSFPKAVQGRALYLPLDNLNTDGIYGKDVTYRDDITPVEQGQYAMLNYDPAFQQIAEPGDIIVSGRNFGTGSSREQAATALASRGIRLVIAATFSETYKRNAYNNGFICIDCPDFVGYLAHKYEADAAAGTRTIIGPPVTVDYAASQITCEGTVFAFDPLSTTAQELVAAGGSENLVRKRLSG